MNIREATVVIVRNQGYKNRLLKRGTTKGPADYGEAADFPRSSSVA